MRLEVNTCPSLSSSSPLVTPTHFTCHPCSAWNCEDDIPLITRLVTLSGMGRTPIQIVFFQSWLMRHFEIISTPGPSYHKKMLFWVDTKKPYQRHIDPTNVSPCLLVNRFHHGWCWCSMDWLKKTKKSETVFAGGLITLQETITYPTSVKRKIIDSKSALGGYVIGPRRVIWWSNFSGST